MLWICAFGMAVALAVAEVDTQIAKTKFSCDGRTSGYYADVESGCQVYHMCDGLGRQFSYTCPNATLFQQRMLICDHWYMVNCSKSERDYTANLRIGHREMPFVDDSESNPYHRTPRPDLLAHRSQSEYDIIYRTGKAQLPTNLNLVGVESDSKNSTPSTTDEPQYSLPSHWSTEYARQSSTTEKPFKGSGTNKKIFEGIGTIKGKPIVAVNSATEPPEVNYKSYFKNTTPVFPKTVELSTEAPDDVGLVPPLPYQLQDNKDRVVTTTQKSVDVKHEFKQSQPEENRDDNVVTTTQRSVNFKSEFKATTPVYPKTVDVTSEEPGDLGILPPVGGNSTNDSRTTILNPPSVQPSVKKNEESEVELPSKYYEPPKFSSDYADSGTDNTKMKKSGFKSLSNNEWEDLRKKFLIPDYEFPLESVSRPSYDSVLSSFQVSPGSPEN